MVLEQDKAQASQAQNIIDQKQYDQDLAQYEKDKKQYEKDLEQYNKELAAQKKAEESIKKAEAEALLQAQSSFRASIDKQLSSFTLDRTTAGIVQGKIQTPYRQLNPEQKSIIDRYRIKTELASGSITYAQAGTRLGISQASYNKAAQERTLRFAEQARKKAVSETLKQDTARGIASLSGAAIGTIQSDGTTSISNKSQTANKINISSLNPVKPIPPTVPTSILQREEKVKVTTPDQKERIFKNRATADKFISRTQNNYQTTQKQNYLYTVNLGSPQKQQNKTNDKNSFANFLEAKNERKYSRSGNPILESVLSAIDKHIRKSDKYQQKIMKEKPHSAENLLLSTYSSLIAQGSSIYNTITSIDKFAKETIWDFSISCNNCGYDSNYFGTTRPN